MGLYDRHGYATTCGKVESQFSSGDMKAFSDQLYLIPVADDNPIDSKRWVNNRPTIFNGGLYH